MTDDIRRFEVGPTYCVLTLMLASKCPHCEELRKLPPGPGLKVVSVDREAGRITFAADD